MRSLEHKANQAALGAETMGPGGEREIPARTPPAFDLSPLVNWILERHHAFVRREGPRIARLGASLLPSLGSEDRELATAVAVFERLLADLQPHMAREELVLFPYIARLEAAKANGQPLPRPPFGTVQNPVRMMNVEHEQAAGELAELLRLTSGYLARAGASAECRAFLDGLRDFDADLVEHMRLETEELFPRAAACEEQLLAVR